jgi:hypothetical protein
VDASTPHGHEVAEVVTEVKLMVACQDVPPCKQRAFLDVYGGAA